MATHYIEGNSMFGNWMVFPTTLNIVAGDTVTFLHGGESSASSMVVSNFGAGKWTSTNMLYVYKGGSASATTISTLGNTSDAILVGGVSVTINIASQGDTVPNAFSFTNVTGQDYDVNVISNGVTIGGIDKPSPTSVVGGAWSKNGGSFTTSSGTVSNGDIVRLRIRTSNQENINRTATLTIGGVSGTYSARTAIADTTVDVSVLKEGPSYIYMVGGSPILIAGKKIKFNHVTMFSGTPTHPYSLTIAGFDTSVWTGGSSLTVPHGGHVCKTIQPNKETRDFVTASISGAPNYNTYYDISGPPDLNPDAFTITSVTNSYPSAGYESNSVQITGINRQVSITTSNCLVSVNHDIFKSTGSISNGGYIRLYATTPSNFGGTTNAWVKVGDRTVNWTLSNRSSPDPAHLMHTSNTRVGFSFKDDVRDFFAGTAVVGPIASSPNLSSYTRGSIYIPNIPENNGVPATAVAGMKLSDYLNACTYLSWERAGGGQFTGGDTTIGQTSATINWSLKDPVPSGTVAIDHPRIGYGNVLGACDIKWELNETTGTGLSTGVTITGGGTYGPNNVTVTLSAATGANTEAIYTGYVRLYIKHRLYTTRVLTRDLPYTFAFKGP